MQLVLMQLVVVMQLVLMQFVLMQFVFMQFVLMQFRLGRNSKSGAHTPKALANFSPWVGTTLGTSNNKAF